ncbi:HAD-IA family hydrolase [Snodgrassella sp. CFCC 13594]|uniref:HAD-IA family hydrolase n=1 Tax=Snodgrassella sp. CFCC 13594 TaxID=1775559 RepID=UPI000A6CBB82|nr:HAD-IA family hydrolase [Snodgrassella sp. CFCC 13594]
MHITKTYQALIFDWDGTLADSIGQIVDAMYYAHQQVGLPDWNPHAAHQVIGLNLREALRRTAPSATEKQIDALVYYYRQRYLSPDNRTQLFTEARTWLPELKQHFWLGIATGKARQGLTKALDETAAAPFFLSTRTVDECAPKPNPDMVLSLCEEFGLYPRDVLVVGDTTHDLLMAANAGADAVAVTTGAHDKATLQTAPHLTMLSGITDLAQWLGLSQPTHNTNPTAPHS